MTTIKEALVQGIHTFTSAGVESAHRDAQVLLGHVLTVERAALYAHPDQQLSEEQEKQFYMLIERRSRGEPVAYLIGQKEFYGRDFLVDKRVLIPRPETELLVETALSVVQHTLKAGRLPIVADIGTGSGAIPITLALEEPRLPYLYASDISAEALELASLNCQRHHVERRVHLLHGDLLEPLPGVPQAVDILIANLPYVGTEEMDVLATDVLTYEPHLALFSGPSGLDLLQRFLEQIQKQQSDKLRDQAVVLLEIGYRQREALTRLVKGLWPEAIVKFQRDYAGWDRVVQIVL